MTDQWVMQMPVKLSLDGNIVIVTITNKLPATKGYRYQLYRTHLPSAGFNCNT